MFTTGENGPQKYDPDQELAKIAQDLRDGKISEDEALEMRKKLQSIAEHQES